MSSEIDEILEKIQKDERKQESKKNNGFTMATLILAILRYHLNPLNIEVERKNITFHLNLRFK